MLARVECVDMAMLLESLEARVIHRGAENFRNYADLAVSVSGPSLVVEGHRQPGAADAGRAGGDHHPLERPLAALHLEAGAGPGGRQHGDPQAGGVGAALGLALGRSRDQAGLPPGVLNIVQGIGEEVGAALVSDRRVRRISFTGSPETARHIGVAAGRNIVPFTAELGGKGPLVVFADSDLEAAARKAAGQYDDAGQICLAGTRLLVEESVSAEFLELFNRITDAHVLGDSRDPRTTISPLIHPDHLARVEGFVERARRPVIG